MTLRDQKLVKRTLAGDVDAYGVLVERYRHAAYGLACHLLGDFEEAKDVTQEALVRAFYRLDDLQDPAKFGPWLRRIVASICADWRRKESRRHESQGPCPDTEAAPPGPHQALLAKELGGAIEEMIGQLPEPNRLAVIMYYIDGLSHQAIGDFLGISAAAAKMRLRRARQRMQKDIADLVAETLQKHSLRPSFCQEVGRMTVSFGISGHGHTRSVFPDEPSKQLYARLYPRGDIAQAAPLAAVPRTRAEELVRRWEQLSVVEGTDGEVLCRAPILTAPDVEELRPWWEAFADIAMTELERRVPELSAMAEEARGEAPIENALEAVVYWQGMCAAVGAARAEGLAPRLPGPKRADTGEYHLFGSAIGSGLPSGYGNSKSDFGDMEGWCLVAVTWFGIDGQAEMADYMRAQEFPVRDDPLLWRLVRPLRSMHERPRTRDELVNRIKERDVTEYPPDDVLDALIRFRFITEEEPHRLLIPVVDERIGTPLYELLCEMRAAIGPKLGAIEPQREQAVQRCSFKDCLPTDVAHICFLKASAWLTPMVFDRGLVPALPQAAYADRGVFLWRYPQEAR